MLFASVRIRKSNFNGLTLIDFKRFITRAASKEILWAEVSKSTGGGVRIGILVWDGIAANLLGN